MRNGFVNGAKSGLVGVYIVDDVALYSLVVGSYVVLVGPVFYDILTFIDFDSLNIFAYDTFCVWAKLSTPRFIIEGSVSIKPSLSY